MRKSEEVDAWYQQLAPKDQAKVDTVVERLASEGNLLRMPLSRSLGEGLFELRFGCEGVERRITYIFEPQRHAITLTTFRKTKQNESGEIKRARKAQSLRKYTDRKMGK